MTLPPPPAPPSLAASPPVGPGVTPPFAAPPTEGRTLRLWLALGVAGLAAVLCCGAGGTALVGLLITSTEAFNEQVEAVAGDYYDAVADKRYQEAYDLLCDDLRDSESAQRFAERMSREPIRSYRVGDARIAADLTVPVDLTYADGDQETVEVTMAQDTGTGDLEVCGFDS